MSIFPGEVTSGGTANRPKLDNSWAIRFLDLASNPL